MKKLRILPVFLALVFLVIPSYAALADTGPKPGMEFIFKQESSGEPLTIISGILYECEQADCSDAAPLEELGPQGFQCDTLHCSATAYGFSPYHRLEIEFSDGKTRQSNIFQTAGFNSTYTVTVRPDDLLVEAQFSLRAFSSLNLLLIGCCCALALTALLVIALVFLLRRKSKL